MGVGNPMGRYECTTAMIKVMLVDDSRTIRNLGKDVLEGLGCEVLLSTDGFHCIAHALDFVPDLFLIDVLMPRLNGYQTVQLLRKKPEFMKTPVIMLSSRDGIFDIARGKAVGATDYITKPFSKDDMARALSYCSLPTEDCL